MVLDLFHPETRRVFCGRRGKQSPDGHTFGGSADYSGLAAYKRQPAVHLLFRLDTHDPAVGVTLPDARWLPLLCAIRYGACDLGYHVVSDTEVKILYQEEKKGWRGFPYSGYPEKLPVRPIAIEEGTYDPAAIEDGLHYGGVFGYGALSAEQYARLVHRVEEDNLADLFGYDSAEAYLQEGNGLPFVQGPPASDCPDPECDNHGRASSLRTFAIFEEDEDDEIRNLWGPDCGGLQIIYQVCPACAAIRTTNQCT